MSGVGEPRIGVRIVRFCKCKDGSLVFARETLLVLPHLEYEVLLSL